MFCKKIFFLVVFCWAFFVMPVFAVECTGDYVGPNDSVEVNDISECFVETYEGMYIETPGGNLVDCPSGYYCPGYETIYYGQTGGATPCPSGTYSVVGGAVTDDDCETCPAGTYSAPGASSCTACPAGKYSAAGASSCTACPAGKYSAAGASSCTACSAGTYSAAGASSCTACSAGTYSASGASSCATCNGATNADHTQCINDCGIGKFINSNKLCDNCPTVDSTGQEIKIGTDKNGDALYDFIANTDNQTIGGCALKLVRGNCDIDNTNVVYKYDVANSTYKRDGEAVVGLGAGYYKANVSEDDLTTDYCVKCPTVESTGQEIGKIGTDTNSQPLYKFINDPDANQTIGGCTLKLVRGNCNIANTNVVYKYDVSNEKYKRYGEAVVGSLPAGYQKIDVADDDLKTDYCDVCPTGSWSAGGLLKCTPCQTGFTTDGSGSTSRDACKPAKWSLCLTQGCDAVVSFSDSVRIKNTNEPAIRLDLENSSTTD